MSKIDLYFQTNGELIPINIHDIIMIESDNNNTRIYTAKQVYLTYQTLQELEDLFSEEEFCRVHRRFIIAFRHIRRIKSYSVFIGDKEIPIGPTY
jgi:DNA-binding LytR/AlgR family response regulator